VLEDQISRRVMNGFYERRGADAYLLLEPYWMFSAHGTTHGTTYDYDAHVSVIFMGPGIQSGTVRRDHRGERHCAHAGHVAGDRDAERVGGARAAGDL
jgi:hypothetical protein